MFSTGEELVLNGKDRERLCRWFRLESPAKGQWMDHFKGIFLEMCYLPHNSGGWELTGILFYLYCSMLIIHNRFCYDVYMCVQYSLPIAFPHLRINEMPHSKTRVIKQS